MALAAPAARVAAPTSARLRGWRWPRLCGLVVVGLVLCGVGPGVAVARARADAPAFEDPGPVVSHDGSVQLSWPGPLGDYEVELRRIATDDAERVAYRGRMPSAHLSGLLEGDYAVRVRAHHEHGSSPWSEPKRIEVRHHPLPLVYALLTLGLLTFAGTAVVVLRSSRRAA